MEREISESVRIAVELLMGSVLLILIVMLYISGYRLFGQRSSTQKAVNISAEVSKGNAITSGDTDYSTIAEFIQNNLYSYTFLSVIRGTRRINELNIETKGNTNEMIWKTSYIRNKLFVNKKDSGGTYTTLCINSIDGANYLLVLDKELMSKDIYKLVYSDMTHSYKGLADRVLFRIYDENGNKLYYGDNMLDVPDNGTSNPNDNLSISLSSSNDTYITSTVKDRKGNLIVRFIKKVI